MIAKRCPWCNGEVVQMSVVDLHNSYRYYCRKCDSVILRVKMSDFEMQGRKKVPQ